MIVDPLKLPFARILQEAQGIRVDDALSRLMTCGACALTLGQQEDLYLQTIKGLSRHDLGVIVRAYHQLIEDMEQRPYTDLLGPVYMAVGNTLDKSRRGEFFTPSALNHLLGRMTIDRDSFPADRPLEGNEPSCGTGGMVLAAAEHCANLGISPLHTRWTLMDLSPTSCYGAFINVTLWGIPAEVVCGDTLSLQVSWRWRNPFWHQATPLPRAVSPLDRVVSIIKRLAAESPPAPLAALPAQPSLFRDGI